MTMDRKTANAIVDMYGRIESGLNSLSGALAMNERPSDSADIDAILRLVAGMEARFRRFRNELPEDKEPEITTFRIKTQQCENSGIETLEEDIYNREEALGLWNEYVIAHRGYQLMWIEAVEPDGSTVAVFGDHPGGRLEDWNYED